MIYDLRIGMWERVAWCVLRVAWGSSDGGPGNGAFLGVGVGGEGGGPGEVAVAGEVVVVAAFGKDPSCAGPGFAQGKEISGDVLRGAGETFLAGGELVHEGETEVAFQGGEVDGKEATAEAVGGFPADLASEAGSITGTGEGRETLQETEEGGFEELPVIGAGGEESTEPEFGAFGFVDVEGGQVALAGGGDVEAKTKCGMRSAECGSC